MEGLGWKEWDGRIGIEGVGWKDWDRRIGIEMALGLR
jgi:hypothetical protein